MLASLVASCPKCKVDREARLEDDMMLVARDIVVANNHAGCTS